MYRMVNVKFASLFLVCGVVLSWCAFPARADDEGEWANIGSDVADMVAENLLSWIEGPLADQEITVPLSDVVSDFGGQHTDAGGMEDGSMALEGFGTRVLSIYDDPQLDEPDPDTPVIVIRLYVDAPWPASNKTIIIEIYPDGRVKITTIHHKASGDVTEVEWRDDFLPEEAKHWLWGPPEEHDLTGDPIDIWSEDGAVEEIENRVQPIVIQRIQRNIAEFIKLTKAAWYLLWWLLDCLLY